MSTHSDVEKFLQAVFGSDYGTHAIFANLNPPAHTRDFRQLDPNRDCYWSIAAFPPDHTGTNTAEAALEVRALVIDDVGTKVMAGAVEVALGLPTAVVETSLHNCQWVYRLSKPVAVADWAGFFGGIEAMIGQKLEAPAAQTLMRLPMGVNTKPLKARFAVRLVELSAVQIDPDTIPRVHRAKSPVSQGAAARQVHDIKQLVEWASNDDLSYDEWIAKGQRIYALDPGEDGREAWHELSARSAKNNPEITETKWHTFTADITRGGLLLAEAQAEGGEAFTRWEAKEVFEDGVVEAEPPPKRKGITLTNYDWTDPDKIPPRDWLYGDILLRRFISMTVAPGGVGKSSLIVAETLAQVTGRNLLGVKPSGKLKVWLWNLEDPLEETQRKIQAAALHYGVNEADIGDRLFVDSGRNQQLIIARMDRNGPCIVQHVMDDLIAEIKRLEIDVVVIDPFVSCHEVPENDNTAQDMVVKAWGKVAELGNCAVHLIDHTRKAPVGTEVTTESSRGGKAKTDAARVVRVINRLTDAQSKLWSVTAPWRYISAFNDKANLAPPLDRQDWFHLESVPLGNGSTAAAAFAGGVNAGVVQGDSVGVIQHWMPPQPTDIAKGDNFTKMVIEMGSSEWRADYQAGDKWIGIPAAKACGLLRHSPKDRQSVKEAISIWLNAGLLKEVSQMDENRKLRKFIKLVGGY